MLAVAVLDEQPAEHARVVALARGLRAPLAVGEDAERLLRAQRLERVVARSPARAAPRRSARRSVGRAPPRPRRLSTATQPKAETGSAASARSQASSIVAATATPHGFAVLDDHGRRLVEVVAHAPRALEVGEVVVRELPCRRAARRARAGGCRAPTLAVVGGRLVRVLAVGEVGDLLEAERELLRERRRGRANQRGDRRVVGGGRRERRRRESAPRLERRARRARAARASTCSYCSGLETAATCAKFFAAARSIDGPPTSIISITSCSVGIGPARGRRERIEVDADEVERLDRRARRAARGRRRGRAARGCRRGSAGAASSRGRRAARARR